MRAKTNQPNPPTPFPKGEGGVIPITPIPPQLPSPFRGGVGGEVGELSPALVRAWGPLLKPTGLGLLLVLHSFEETTPGHSFFGWAHCTQTTLAAYLDTSQDTIARYSNLLLLCGLMQVQ